MIERWTNDEKTKKINDFHWFSLVFHYFLRQYCWWFFFESRKNINFQFHQKQKMLSNKLYYLWSIQIWIFIGIGAAEHDLLVWFAVSQMDRKCLQSCRALMGLIIYPSRELHSCTNSPDVTNHVQTQNTETLAIIGLARL